MPDASHFRIVGLWSGEVVPSGASEALLAAASRPEFGGKPGDMGEAFDGEGRTVALRLGPPSGQPGNEFRKAVAAACKRAIHVKADSVVLVLPPGANEAHARAAGETAGLLSWNGGIYKSDAPDSLPSWGLEPPYGEAFHQGLMTAAAVNGARTLAFTPPSEATPLAVADHARRVAEASGLSWSVLEGEALKEEKLWGIYTVGKASENPPCLIRLEWNPGGSEEQPLVLVGKTVTYDTGGLSLKGKTTMPGMKGDKAGGCAVIAAMEIIATVLKPQRRIIALLPAAENSVSGSAYRPDDVITFGNGVSVEVTNTDAEGRLVLADALWWACEREGAKAVVDVATLTGGVVTALGDVMAGLFANDEELAEALLRAGADCGERLWRLPLDEAYKDYMKSDVADLVNSNLNGKAHPVQGATFLWRFVSPGVAWAHLDIAGVAQRGSEGPLMKAGPTGFGARLLALWASGEEQS